MRVARRNLDRSRRELAAGDDDGALIAAEAAMVSAADAVLARDGYRLRGKTGSHEARFAYPGPPPEFATEARIAETARKLRNVALYEEPDVVSPSLARDAVAAAARLIEAAERAVNPPG